MAKNAANRWKGWRIDEGGRSIKSNPDHDAKAGRKGRKRRGARVKQAPVTARKMDTAEKAWWWTPTGRRETCAECHEPVEKGQLKAYCHAERRAVCAVCVDRLGLAPRMSKKAKARAAARPVEREPLDAYPEVYTGDLA